MRKDNEFVHYVPNSASDDRPCSGDHCGASGPVDDYLFRARLRCTRQSPDLPPTRSNGTVQRAEKFHIAQGGRRSACRRDGTPEAFRPATSNGRGQNDSQSQRRRWPMRAIRPSPRKELAGDRAPETVASVPPGGAMKMASAPAAAPGESAVPAVAPAATLVEQQTPAGTEAGADDLPAATPISGPIPLPRQRPRDPSTMRIADMAPSSVPIPRPRPDTAGPGAPSGKTNSPIGFIQNLFH